jgi:hypothetical protein
VWQALIGLPMIALLSYEQNEQQASAHAINAPCKPAAAAHHRLDMRTSTIHKHNTPLQSFGKIS